jgi:hypothetical protein
MHELYFGVSDKKDRLALNGEPVQQLQEIMIRLGYLAGSADGTYDELTKIALRTFTGNENFEERINLEEGWIDRPVLEYLVKKFGN